MLIIRLIENVEMDKERIKVIQDATSQIVKFSFVSCF